MTRLTVQQSRQLTTHNESSPPTKTAPIIPITSIPASAFLAHTAPLFRAPVCTAVALANTDTEPIVGLGGGPFTPFIASASRDSCAKPTDGGE